MMNDADEAQLIGRMQETFNRAEPNSREHFKGMLRARTRRRSTQSARRKPRFNLPLTVLLLLGTSSAFAYVGVKSGAIRVPFGDQWRESRSVSQDERTPDARAQAQRIPAQHRSLDHESAPAPEAPVHLESLGDQALNAQGASPPSGTPRAPERTARARINLRSEPNWADVSSALRSDDPNGAIRLLSGLAQRGSEEQRQSAELLSLQIKLASEPANNNDRERLARLASFGATLSIRTSAGRTLSGLPSSPRVAREK